MNTGPRLHLTGRCSWIPGSRAAPRNDGHLALAGKRGPTAARPGVPV